MHAEPRARYKVSIITAVLNARATLAQTIASIAAQDYPALEYIIVDGGSTDGTREVIADWRDRVDVLIEEQDSGIAEAMNKGLARASGDLVLFLHADDRLADDAALTRAVSAIDSSDAIWAFDILFGTVGHPRRYSPRPFNAWTRFKNPLPHQGVLCPRRLYDRLGGFDPSLKICMDYEFFLRAYLAGITLRRVPTILAVMGSAGVSSRRDWDGLRARLGEERRVQARHAGGAAWRAVSALYWPLYLSYRRVRALRGGPR